MTRRAPWAITYKGFVARAQERRLWPLLSPLKPSLKYVGSGRAYLPVLPLLVHNRRVLGSVARANGTRESYFARNPMLALNIYYEALLHKERANIFQIRSRFAPRVDCDAKARTDSVAARVILTN